MKTSERRNTGRNGLPIFVCFLIGKKERGPIFRAPWALLLTISRSNPKNSNKYDNGPAKISTENWHAKICRPIIFVGYRSPLSNFSKINATKLLCIVFIEDSVLVTVSVSLIVRPI